ncbi:phage major capsid protein [Evansella cellulosilytica]|uniref:Phage major capsid protein, HK97 family n=1 Tax=Evansella cellulosilytica (strain ATCC 21833 / DSM 2522 / FERM P-1141 / JCM 9156 / N-4) TaxID=649639 RepID=E6U1J6_EVAC2|nr:phage major capsid protein [Evansella cellulosilytica]ADU30359.1 phage major capsid protein, HK97 family [Evansella cellulosilytica DSM 2522]
MPKELRELLNKINTKKEEAKALLTEKKLEEAKALTTEIKTLQEEYEVAATVYEETKNLVPDEPQAKQAATDLSLAFAKAVVGKASEEEFKNLMQEGAPEKGGVTVPKDVQTRIIELQRKSFDIRNYINVEPVSTFKGSRPIEANQPEAVGFASVDEGAAIQKLHEPEFDELEYAIRKYAGFIPLTNELLDDTAENILAYIIRWMAKNELNTYNYQFFNGTGNKSSEGIMVTNALEDAKVEVDFTGTPNSVIKKFKTTFNVDLEDIDSDSMVIMTNATGYDFIDGLEDKQGKPYLQPDVTKASGYSFLGKEIVKVPSKFLQNVTEGEEERTPFVVGDLNLLYTMFDRKQMSVESSKIGGTAWREDKTEVKGIFRFDGRVVDDESVRILLAKLA